MGGVKSKKKSSVICVGLDNSGKSTIINYLKPAKTKTLETQATIGFQSEEFTFGKVNFNVFDMSGQGRYRNLWEYYYKDTEGIIFVIDSSDDLRLAVVKDELETLLAHEAIQSKPVPILFFANKMDLPKSLNPSQISEYLELNQITDRQWNIVPSNALTGTGVEEGITWMSGHLP